MNNAIIGLGAAVFAVNFATRLTVPKHPGAGSAEDDDNPNTPWHKQMDARIAHHRRGTFWALVAGAIMLLGLVADG